MHFKPVSDLLKSRFSCRAFTEKQVSQETILQLLEYATLSPSGTNLQPWKVHIVMGDMKDALSNAIKKKMPDAIKGEGFDFRIYPEEMSDDFRQRRNECSETLYGALGIPREDREGRIKYVMRNSEFFGAPVGFIITVDPCIAETQLVDCGIFLQSLMLLAEEAGLGTCSQGFWAAWPDTVREVLDIKDELVVVGLALGYKDPNSVINTVRQSRLQVEAFTTVHM